jgi:hypothetical protein
MTLPKFKSLTPRQKIMLSTAVTLLVTASVLLFVTLPSVRAIRSLADQIFEQRLELERMYHKGQILKHTLKQYEEVKPAVQELSRIYITTGEELQFITTLEGVAQAAGVHQDIKLGAKDPKDKTAANKLPYQLEIEGNLTSLIAYLGGLESLDFYVNIDTLRFSHGSVSSGHGQSSGSSEPLTAILLATSYFKL